MLGAAPIVVLVFSFSFGGIVCRIAVATRKGGQAAGGDPKRSLVARRSSRPRISTNLYVKSLNVQWLEDWKTEVDSCHAHGLGYFRGGEDRLVGSSRLANALPSKHLLNSINIGMRWAGAACYGIIF